MTMNYRGARSPQAIPDEAKIPGLRLQGVCSLCPFPGNTKIVNHLLLGKIKGIKLIKNHQAVQPVKFSYVAGRNTMPAYYPTKGIFRGVIRRRMKWIVPVRFGNQVCNTLAILKFNRAAGAQFVKYRLLIGYHIGYPYDMLLGNLR